jgi:hypothetical protein
MNTMDPSKGGIGMSAPGLAHKGLDHGGALA